MLTDAKSLDGHLPKNRIDTEGMSNFDGFDGVKRFGGLFRGEV